MRAICPRTLIASETKQILMGLLIAVVVMYLPQDGFAAPNGSSALHFTFKSAMTNTTVEPDARGAVNGDLDQQRNINTLRLRISLAKLEPNMMYLLVAHIGSDTNAITVTEFATDPKGAFKVNYVKRAGMAALSGGEPLPDVLNPICTVRELDIVNLGGQTVLQSDLTDPDSLQYDVNNSLINTGFIPAAVGTLRIDATKHHSHFNLRAAGLTPGAVYLVTINGSVALTNTTDHTGKLNLKAPLPGSIDVLDIQAMALTDSTGSNVVLVTDGLGVPCSTAVPIVSLVFPANNASGVPINTQLAATFSEAMDPLTISTASFVLQQGITAVTGTVSYVGVTATFTTAGNLVPLTNYTATITTAVTDLAGNALAANFAWNFTTGATADTTPPIVTSTIPSNGAPAVAINQSLAATFSETMDPLTITTASFTLHQGATAVTGTVSYAGLTATFTPLTNLTILTTYSATITTGVTDLARNALTNNFVWSFTTGSSADTTTPTVVTTNPTNTTANVALNQTINATFSEAMDPTTINTAHFTVTGPGATTITGTVTYVAASQIASFTPVGNLAPDTMYTNTITTGVEDLTDNALATNFVWSFTTGAQIDTNLMAIDLGATSTFAILATAAISGGADQINGDVGLHPGSAQGIPTAEINGTIHVNDQAVIDAQTSLLAAYSEAVNRSNNAKALPTNLGGLRLFPGLYSNGTSTGISGTGANGILTLDAQGDANAVFVFQTASTLITDAGTSIVLSGGAQAKNIFWRVGSSATLNTTTIFKGNILAAVTITVNNGSAVDGRLFAGSGGNGSGAVTVQSSTVTVPAP